MRNQLDEAIELIESGNREGGYQLLTQILETNPQNDKAWLWMATIVDSDELRAECLQEVLKHAPRNKAAREALSTLEASKLGKCLAVYKGKGLLTPIAILLLSVAGAFIIPGLITQGERSSLNCLIPLCCGMFALAAVYEIIIAIPTRQVTVYEDGIVHNTMRSSRIVRWDDVTQVWQSYWRGRTHYTLEVRGEKKPLNLTSDHFKDLDSLGKMIQEKVTRCLLPKYAEMLNAGKSAYFGRLTLDRSGITRDNKTIPWEKIERVDVQRGIVVIRQRGQWMAWPRVPALQIPNLYVFLALVDQLVGMSQYRH